MGPYIMVGGGIRGMGILITTSEWFLQMLTWILPCVSILRVNRNIFQILNGVTLLIEVDK